MAEYYEGYDYYNDPLWNQPVGSQEDQPWMYPMPADTEEDGGGGNWWQTLLSGAGSLASRFGAPAASVIGGLTNAGRGANAAQQAGQQQSQALNRGIDLQTAQWLQQQQNLAPYLQAGQQGLATLQGLAGREQPGLPGATSAVSRGQYEMDMPNATPAWNPRDYYGPEPVKAGSYRWNPQQGPQAQDYRYTPGTIPQAANYRYTPGAVPTLSGQELLANDPGVAFRMAEGRKALEASAAARGGLLSGGALAALQRQGQELGSQEYANAWGRASQQAQLREGWAQTASQMGWGQAESEARLREQVNQIASQQGWSQAQAEAAFRESMAQQSSQQGFNQALGAQGQQFTQGLQQAQWNQGQQQQFAQERYKNMLDQARWRYGTDVATNQTDYDRQQAAYRQQLAQFLLPWEQQSTLATLGGNATVAAGTQGQNATNAISNLLGQQGQAQAGATLGGALAQQQGTTTTANSIASVLSSLNR